MAPLSLLIAILFVALILTPQGFADYYKPLYKHDEPPKYKHPIEKSPVYKPAVYKPSVYKLPVYKPPVHKLPVYNPPVHKPLVYNKPPYHHDKPPHGKYPPQHD
ncbi:repetitive proline-rich cell wall protein 1-like [Arachis duranensis]|uniref:Repetitive proline-rich cell wall protein 1-like n=1 Tax=Arachis duranensis TaxID=130453 RepID=A0A9C6T4H8_ARADU|nr:repetitive proline-rich cell wall protein 1-like [Arachis duranensis]